MSVFSEYVALLSSANNNNNNNNYSVGNNIQPASTDFLDNNGSNSNSSSSTPDVFPSPFDTDKLMQQMLFDMQMTPPPLPFLPLPSRSSLFDYPPIMKQQQPSPLFNQHRADSSSTNNNLYSASTIALFNSLRPLPHNQSQLITDSMINNRYYKTALCHAWQETGVCAFGGLCRYAHGDADLRSIQMTSAQHHPTPSRVRTQLCFNYSLYGDCIHGNQCKFVHYNGDNPIETLRMATTSGNGSIQRSIHHRGPMIRTSPINIRGSTMNTGNGGMWTSKQQ